jgi:hypothetical protein
MVTGFCGAQEGPIAYVSTMNEVFSWCGKCECCAAA